MFDFLNSNSNSLNLIRFKFIPDPYRYKKLNSDPGLHRFGYLVSIHGYFSRHTMKYFEIKETNTQILAVVSIN